MSTHKKNDNPPPTLDYYDQKFVKTHLTKHFDDIEKDSPGEKNINSLRNTTLTHSFDVPDSSPEPIDTFTPVMDKICWTIVKFYDFFLLKSLHEKNWILNYYRILMIAFFIIIGFFLFSIHQSWPFFSLTKIFQTQKLHSAQIISFSGTIYIDKKEVRRDEPDLSFKNITNKTTFTLAQKSTLLLLFERNTIIIFQGPSHFSFAPNDRTGSPLNISHGDVSFQPLKQSSKATVTFTSPGAQGSAQKAHFSITPSKQLQSQINYQIYSGSLFLRPEYKELKPLTLKNNQRISLLVP